MKRFLFGLALIVLLPFQAFGFGEIFKIETTGTEYCGDFDFTKFNPNNNVDLWVRVVSASELTVSLTPNFAAGSTFPMTGKTYLTTATAAAFRAWYAVFSGLCSGSPSPGVGIPCRLACLKNSFSENPPLNLAGDDHLTAHCSS